MVNKSSLEKTKVYGHYRFRNMVCRSMESTHQQLLVYKVAYDETQDDVSWKKKRILGRNSNN